MPVVADRLINQNITSNKAIQYGMLAAETVLELGILAGLSNQPSFVKEFQEYFSHLFSTDLINYYSVDAKKLIALVIGSSFIHKYIWDQPNESVVELDQNSDIPIDIDGIKMEAATNTFDTI